jgi:hypothetical protein
MAACNTSLHPSRRIAPTDFDTGIGRLPGEVLG